MAGQHKIESILTYKAIALADASIVRPLPAALLASWDVINIAFRFAVEDPAVNFTGTPRFMVGLNSGATTLPGQAACPHFVGLCSTNATWTRSATTTRFTLSMAPAKIVDGSLSVGTDCFTTGVSTSLFWKFLRVQITKGSPNYTLNSPYFLNANTSADDTVAELIKYGGLQETGLSYTNHGAGSAQTIAVDEGADGTLDHVGIWWNRGWKMYITDLMVSGTWSS